jgi:cysteine synthase
MGDDVVLGQFLCIASLDQTIVVILPDSGEHYLSAVLFRDLTNWDP